MNPLSSIVVDGVEQAPSRAMLYPTGFKPEDFSKPQIGIASTWSMVTCNMHINELLKPRLWAWTRPVLNPCCSTPLPFPMVFPWAHRACALLVSREAVADSIETVVGAQGLMASLPSAAATKICQPAGIAMACMDQPSVFVYGGTILPGKDRRDIVSVFEAVGGHAAGNVSDIELKDVEATAIPGLGSCGGMYTANTMASSMRLSVCHCPAVRQKRGQPRQKTGQPQCRRSGAQPDQTRHQAQHILSREAFENAITLTIALEGSTNAVLHLLAIAHAANIPLSIDDFSRIGKRVPVLADMRPAAFTP